MRLLLTIPLVATLQGQASPADRAIDAAVAAYADIRTARATFEQGVITSALPTIEVKRAELEKGVGVLNASLLVGFVQSTGEARRQIKGGGLKVNDKPVDDERRLLVADGTLGEP